jgi:hypothetical protein
VYYGPDSTRDDSTAAMPAPRPSEGHVTLTLGEVLPLLADAYQSRRTWLGDFELDPVTLSSDLYEVLLAYQHFRRPSA